MIDIIWNTNIDPSGYSSCARSYVKALYENKECSISVFVNNVAININSMGIGKKDLLFFSSITTDRLIGEYVVNHSVPDRMIFGNEKNILYTMSEGLCPDRWVQICNKCDLVMTASDFCKEKMIESGITGDNIVVVPHCHDRRIWNDKVKPLNIRNLKGFNFLFMGDYTPRKNGDYLIENFIKTFRGNKDVSLTIKAYFNSFSIVDQNKLIRRIRNVVNDTGVPESERPKIYFYGEPIYEEHMPRFMSSFDCLISPHRCEGWGLSMSQMMSLGRPVIATKYSGNLQFMNEENSFLIETDGFEPVCQEMIDLNSYFEDQHWPILKRESICDLMNHVYSNRSDANKKAEMANIDMNQYDYKPTSELIIKTLESI